MSDQTHLIHSIHPANSSNSIKSANQTHPARSTHTNQSTHPVPLLEFRNVSKSFNNKLVLNNVNLQIFEKEIFGLVGISGSGKTTLMRLLLGFYEVDSGQILFKGQDYTHKLYELRMSVGFATQENSFYAKLTTKENLMYYSRLYGIEKKEAEERIRQLFLALDLVQYADVTAGKLSGGTKKRVDFAISMIHNPDIIILDEPTTGLDPILRKKLWDLIKIINKIGKSVIFSSHLFDEIENNCTRVAILNHGMIKTTASISYLKQQYGLNDFVAIFEDIVGKND